MTIKSDKWIKQQCMWQNGVMRDTPMISPFEPRQVRTKRVEVTNQEKLLWLNAIDLSQWPDGYSYDPLTNQVFQIEKIISMGCSSFGYDISLADDFRVFSNINSTMLDPKNFDEKSFVKVSGQGFCIIPPNSFVLGSTLEYFNMPRDVTALVMNKSTYARVGINCTTTVIEAGWSGNITLEFSNTTPLPAKIYANEGCAQLLFYEGDEDCDVSYADRKGKYMDQRGLTLPKV